MFAESYDGRSPASRFRGSVTIFEDIVGSGQNGPDHLALDSDTSPVNDAESPEAERVGFFQPGLDNGFGIARRNGVEIEYVGDGNPKGLAFADLKQLCGLTDGNLSRHLQVLQEAGLVDVIKGYEGNRPHTTCRLTKTGRRRFLDYLAVLEQLVRDAAKAAGKDAGAPGRLGVQTA